MSYILSIILITHTKVRFNIRIAIPLLISLLKVQGFRLKLLLKLFLISEHQKHTNFHGVLQ